ncbi:MAG: tetraacyldisaccharide 4'-kinase [Alphaproteobacteria bacterium]
MVSKTPEFWYTTSKTASLISGLLSPISCLYQLGHRLNLSSKKTHNASIPVICIGNATAGGSGKTPTAIAIMNIIKESELSSAPCFLTRGYGGTEIGPRVISGHDGSHDVGDEPLILKNHAKTIISKDRVAGAKKINELNCTCIIMDDGLQNPSLKKDISFLVIDGKTGFGNQKTIPAGPLREPIEQAFQRSDAIILIGQDQKSILELCPPYLPVFQASIKPHKDNLNPDDTYIAFAGLGHPTKFQDTLNAINLDIHNFHAFPDHYPYKTKDMEKLVKEAHKAHAKLITTEKDFQRIPNEFKSKVQTLPITLSWDKPQDITSFLNNALRPFKNKPHEKN